MTLLSTPASDRLRSAVGRALVTATAVFAVIVVPAPESRAAEFESFASTVLFLDSGLSPDNVTCYLANAGRNSIRVKGLRIFGLDGVPLPLEANTCGDVSGFSIPAGKACYVGTTQSPSQGYGCAALAPKGAALRGEVELRDSLAIVRASAELTPPPPDAQSSGFTRVASPPMFGADDQNGATCLFTNVGTQQAKIKNVQFVSSTGQIVSPKVFGGCTIEDGVVTAPPRTTCRFGTSGLAAVDFQCRAEVSRRPDIRGAMAIVRSTIDVANFLPVE